MRRTLRSTGAGSPTKITLTVFASSGNQRSVTRKRSVTGRRAPASGRLTPPLQKDNTGVTVFASSGNDGSGTEKRPAARILRVRPGLPTTADHVTCDSNEQRGDWHHGPGPLGAIDAARGRLGRRCGNGTSASATQASGCASPCGSKSAFPGLRPTEMRNLLLSTGDTVTDPEHKRGFPRVLSVLRGECGGSRMASIRGRQQHRRLARPYQRAIELR